MTSRVADEKASTLTIFPNRLGISRVIVALSTESLILRSRNLTMIHHLFRRSNARQRSERCGARLRRRQMVSCIEGLEARVVPSGNPTVYTVDLLSDSGAGSGTSGDLAYCVNLANRNTSLAGSLIEFSPTVFATQETITLAGTLVLSETPGPETILGPSGQPVTFWADSQFQAMTVAAPTTATLSNVNIAGGFTTGDGGGISNAGDLTLDNCAVTRNATTTKTEHGGGIYNATDAQMTVTHCVISDNSASGGYGGAGGGGIENSGNMTITGSSVDNNSAPGGYGGGIDNFGTLTVADSTVSSNSSYGGGGISNASHLTMTYSTVALNSAETGGGGIVNDGFLTADNVTIAENLDYVASGGGGLQLYDPATLVNTIVAANDSSVNSIRSPDDIATSGSYVIPYVSTNNLIGPGGAGGLMNGQDQNQVGVTDPGLASLANNGGPTQTIALYSNSPAIGAGTYVPSIGTTDQRGPGYSSIYQSEIDIGAFELQPPPPPPPPPAPTTAIVDSVSVGFGVHFDLLVTASDGLRLLPDGRQTDLPWLNIDELSIRLSQAASLTAADVSIVGLKGGNYGPVTVTGSGMYFTIHFARPIEKADRVTVTIAGAGISTFTRRLDVLPGDFNDDGVVNNADLTGIHNEWKRKHGATPNIFGEITGDATVTGADYQAAKKFLKAKLPKLPQAAQPALAAAVRSQAILVRVPARRHHDFRVLH
jgi:hypothetical protein